MLRRSIWSRQAWLAKRHSVVQAEAVRTAIQRQCASEIERWLKMVTRLMTPRMAEGFSRLFVLENGQYTFNDLGQSAWMTELGEIPFDARMTLDRGRWVFDVPFSSHELVLSANKNLKYLARILMRGNIPVPSALLVDGLLLREFQNRPPCREYFRRTFRKYTIHAETSCRKKQSKNRAVVPPRQGALPGCPTPRP